MLLQIGKSTGLKVHKHGFHPNGGGSFDRFGDTRQTLKMYDPGLARLLTEVYGDGQWRYTLPETRTHLRHLLGVNPRETPTFNGWPELETLYRKLSNPNSTGGGEWVNLKFYTPNQLSRLTGSNVYEDWTTTIFVNSTDADVLIYGVSSNATESFWTRIYPGRVRWTGSSVNKIWLVKDASGRDMAVFRSEQKTGRVLLGATPHQTPEEQPSLTVDVNADGKVNKTDLRRVVNALGKKATAKNAHRC